MEKSFYIVFPGAINQVLGSDNICLNKWSIIQDAAVYMRFSREMNDYGGLFLFDNCLQFRFLANIRLVENIFFMYLAEPLKVSGVV